VSRLAVFNEGNWKVWLPVIVAPFLLLAPVWLTGKALFWGTVSLQFAPWRAYAYELLRQGELPLWNPLAGMGAPLWANYQAGLAYPPNWLYFLLHWMGGAAWAAWGQALLVAAHLAWAGMGMARLAKRLGLGELGQIVSGLAFGMSGYLTARAGFLSINAAVAWTPWLIWGIEQVIHREGKGLATAELSLAVIVAMQLLAGHAQTTWYTLLLAGMWWLWRLAGQPRVRHSLAALSRLAAAGALGWGMAAIQWLPTAEYLSQSQRAGGVGYEFAMIYSFWPWRFLTLLAPNMFGTPAQGNYWGYGNLWEDAVYIGVLPLALALAAIARAARHRGRGLPLAAFLALVTLSSFILALGEHTPIFPFLYRYIPTFALFQAPTRFTIWAVFALALLGGMGVDGWRRPEKRSLYWTRLGVAGAAAVMIGAGVVRLLIQGVQLTFLSATALAGFWAAGVGALALLAPRKGAAEGAPASTGWGWGVILWVCADLLVASWGLNPGIERQFYTRANPLPAAVEGGRIYLPAAAEYDLKFNQYMRFASYEPLGEWESMRQAFLPNLSLYDQVAMVNNFDPLQPGRYRRWMERLESADAAQQAIALNLMAVSVVEHKEPGQAASVRFEPLNSTGRVRWTPCVLTAADEQAAWELVWSGSLDFTQTVVVEGLEEETETPCAASQILGKTAILAEQANHVVIEAEAAQAGWLWIADVWYPGWRVWVDGKAMKLYRGNYLFRAIPLEAGRHEVKLAYQPLSFYAGAALSGIVWLVWIAAWRATRKKP
jgi:hypothetical protein